MKTFKITQTELEEKIIELLKSTQDVDMLSGFKKWICWDEEDGLYISDWLSQGTSLQFGVMLYGQEAWNTVEAVGPDAMQDYYDDEDFSTKEEAEQAAAEEYYEWEAYSDQIEDVIKYRLEEMKNLNREVIEVV